MKPTAFFFASLAWSALFLPSATAGLPVDLPMAAPEIKNARTLFHPTPRSQMREMSTDRPDQTESPNTVDAGHVQVEVNAIGATFDREDGVRTREIAFAGTNFKLGLLNNVDLQFVFDPYLESRTKSAGITENASGSGELATRLKINFWGNDGGSTAFAIMPFVKYPLSASDFRNGETEWGIIPIFGFELPGGWDCAVMPEVDFVADGNGGYDTEYFLTATTGHAITEKLGGYLELAATITPDSGEDWQGQVDLGLTYAVSDDFQLDCGCNFGVTDTAPDYSPFVGFSVRY